MARTFDFATGPNYAITGVGSCGAVGNGAYTIAALFNITGNAGIISFRTTGINAQLIVDTSQLFGAGDFQGGQTGVTTGTWWWAAIRKAAGSSVYQYSLRAYNSGSTTHQSGSVNHADSGVTNTSIRLGDGDDRGNGSIAVWAAWTSALSDSQVASMFTTAAADVAAQSPQALWLGNQGSSANAIPDSTGNGAGSTSFNGTVGVGTDPPAYNYSLTAAQASAIQPIVATGPRPAAAGQQVLLRNAAALVVAPAKGSAPLVVTQPGRAPASAAMVRRNTLADAPILTAPRPIVVAVAAVTTAVSTAILLTAGTAPVAPAAATPQPYVVGQPTAVPVAAAPVLVRNPAAPAPGIQPAVVTSTLGLGPGQALLLRSSLADAPVLTTVPPLVVTATVAPLAAAAILARAPLPGAVVPPAATAAPYVVTAPATSPAGAAQLVRSSLADPPVLTTGAPIVVTGPVVPGQSSAILLRNAQPAALPATGPTTVPLVVTTSVPPPAGTVRTLRSGLADAVAATPGPLVVSAPSLSAPSRPIIVRGSLVDVVAGVVARPLVVTAPVVQSGGFVLLAFAPQPGGPAPIQPRTPTVTVDLARAVAVADLSRPAVIADVARVTAVADLTRSTASADLTRPSVTVAL